MYKDWAASTINRYNEILNTARKGHAEAVKTRIEDVKPLSNVVEITKQLFDVSKVCKITSILHKSVFFMYRCG